MLSPREVRSEKIHPDAALPETLPAPETIQVLNLSSRQRVGWIWWLFSLLFGIAGFPPIIYAFTVWSRDCCHEAPEHCRAYENICRRLDKFTSEECAEQYSYNCESKHTTFFEALSWGFPLLFISAMISTGCRPFRILCVMNNDCSSASVARL